jgi:peptide/nickel transport system ATP-binding protein
VREALLKVRDLTKRFPIASGMRRGKGWFTAVDGVSFDLMPGQTLGLVGESGCGKTTTGRMILRLIEPTSGQIIMRSGQQEIDLVHLRAERLRLFRRHVQMIFQDPYSSLNPRLRVLDIIGEPLRALTKLSPHQIEDRVRDLAQQVGLLPDQLRRYPHAFSGGQRQRICIARALALNPALIVCDEPVSALDVSVRAQIINLLKDLQAEHGLAYLFVAHDLSVVENISTRVAVMFAGRIVELAPNQALFQTPAHPYTMTLLDAVPEPDPALRENPAAESEDPAIAAPVTGGCPFHSRCLHAKEQCREEAPALLPLAGDHRVACHFASEIQSERMGQRKESQLSGASVVNSVG